MSIMSIAETMSFVKENLFTEWLNVEVGNSSLKSACVGIRFGDIYVSDKEPRWFKVLGKVGGEVISGLHIHNIPP